MTTYDFISGNKRKTALLMAVFAAFVLAIGWFLDRVYDTGGAAVIIAGGYSVVSGLVSYYAGDRMALAMSGARPVNVEDAPRLVHTIENLCIASGTPLPKIHIIPDPAINAFATGRDPEHASIAVTTGALEKLDNGELEGVLAHELSHIRNYDIRLMTVVIVLVGTVAMLSQIFFRFGRWGGRSRDRRGGDGGLLLLIGAVLLIFAPLIAQLIKLAVSRRREYLADASGALLTRFPDGLASALRKIQVENQPLQNRSAATAHLYIANPYSGSAFADLFSTHPPIEKRITALEKMGRA